MNGSCNPIYDDFLFRPARPPEAHSVAVRMPATSKAPPGPPEDPRRDVCLYLNGLIVAGTVLPRNFCTFKERLGAGLGGCTTYVVLLPPAGPERSGCGPLGFH